MTGYRTARNSRPLEVIGTYDPVPKRDTYDDGTGKLHKDIKLDVTRAQYWVGVGAQPTDVVWRLLSMVPYPPRFHVACVVCVCGTNRRLSDRSAS